MRDVSGPVRFLTDATVGAVLGTVWGMKVTGLERVPRTGALLVACNHISLLDPPLLAAAIAPVRRPHFLGKKELFKNPILSWLFRKGGAIPIDREKADHSALGAALRVLEEGSAIVVFPEGTRVKPGQAREPKAGVSFLASHAGAPVVPARVLGSAEFPLEFPLEVRFGDPLPAPAPGGGRPAAAAYARVVMDAIYSL